MPYLLCFACLAIVLENNEKARGVYSEIVKSYRLPDIQTAFKKLEVELPPEQRLAMVKENVEDFAVRQGRQKDELQSLPPPDAKFFKAFGDGMAQFTHVFDEYIDAEGDRILSTDFKYWLGLIDELIRVGFNSASEQAERIYKLTIASSITLAGVIQKATFGEYSRVESVHDGTTTAIRISGRTCDLTRLLADMARSREHRSRTKAYKKAG